MSLNTCFICDKGFTEGNGVIVKRKGILTFLKSSYIRKDGKADVIKNLESVKVHEECRKRYARIDRIIHKTLLTSHQFDHPLKRNCGPLNQHLILKSRVFFVKKKLMTHF